MFYHCFLVLMSHCAFANVVLKTIFIHSLTWSIKIIFTYLLTYMFNFFSVRRSPMIRPQQDFSRSFCLCCCPPLLSCSFLVPLGLLSHCPSTCEIRPNKWMDNVKEDLHVFGHNVVFM